MSERISIDIELLKTIFSDLNALKGQFIGIEQAVRSVEKTVGSGFSEVSETINQVNGNLGTTNEALGRMRAIDISAIAGSFEAIGNRLNEAVEPGIQFQSAMADLSAITGLTGEALDVVGQNARDLTKELGGEAAGTVEAYKLMLSQLNPELAKSPRLLNEMARNAILLGKTMKGDTAGAAEVLTTVMNQFAIDTANPYTAAAEMSRIMNVMAAAAKEGSAELPALKEAMMSAGSVARVSGVSIEETAAAIEVLDKAGLKASEGGVALRNVLATMNEGRFMDDKSRDALKQAGVDVVALGDKTKTLKERMELIKPILNDSALMTKVFGRENIVGATALASMTDLLGEYTTKVTGTRTANEQAATIMDTFAERLSRTKAWFSDLGISIFGATEQMIPFMNTGFSAVSMLADLKNAQAGLAMIMNTKLVSGLTAAFTAMRTMSVAQMLQATTTGIVTGATAAFNAVLAVNPIVWVVAALAALVAALVYCWENFEGFRAFLYGMWESVKSVFGSIKDYVMGVFKGLGDVVGGFVQAVKSALDGDWSQAYAGVRRMGEGLASVVPDPLDFAKAAGEAADAYNKGAAEGIYDFRMQKSNEAIQANLQSRLEAIKMPGGIDAFSATPGGGLGASGLLGGKGAPNAAGASAGGKGVTVGDGQGGDRNISMNVTMNVTFPVGRDAGDPASVADKVVQMITQKLNDAQLALG
ncbi:MAG: phage tail tape measure protein [Flavobacteriales bacterium]|nr:phage tail tape measure protein [Flavobacteriales bacterium]